MPQNAINFFYETTNGCAVVLPLNSLLCGWNYLTWQCSVESHNYFTEKNLTGESPGPRIVWWCRQHAETPPSLCIFQHGDQDVGLIELGFQWGFYFKKRGAILLF